MDEAKGDVKFGLMRGHELEEKLHSSLPSNNERLLRKDSLAARRGGALHRQRSLAAFLGEDEAVTD